MLLNQVSIGHADKYSILKQYFGYERFREGQEWLIDNVLAGKDVVGIMPTGAGKSICFQVPALMKSGIALVISPLISLMKDQVSSLTQAGVSAAYINSSLTPAQNETVLEKAKKGAYKILYVAPERLLTGSFIYFAQNAELSLMTVDEAHCISQWGHDFRPSYVKIAEFIDGLKRRPAVAAFTATATAEVRDDIVRLLRLDHPEVLVTGFDRKNLYFEVQKPKNKFNALIDFLRNKRDKSGIVYCATRKTTDEVFQKLSENGYGATRYHAGLTDEERKCNQDDFIFDRKQIIVATNAFGMGIDKSNVSYVVHYNMPKNIESYYQEAGRAGRDGGPADCILFYSGQDVRTNQYFIEKGNSAEDIEEETKQQILERDRRRLKEMTFYCHTNDCLREYILKYFGERAENYCGNCGNCSGNYENIDITQETQKILSCIARSGQKYGIKTVIDMLRGRKSEAILKRGLDKLSTYNIMEKESEDRIRTIINHLILNGYIRVTDDEYPIAQLDGKAPAVLFEGKHVCMKLAKETEKETEKKKEKARGGTDAVNPGLLEKLKKLRLLIAAAQKVPAFVIFSDAALSDMCKRMPKNEDEFLQVSGVGKMKLERFGKQFLKVIAGYVSGEEPEDAVMAGSGLPGQSQYGSDTQKSGIKLSRKPIKVSNFVDNINGFLLQKNMRKVSIMNVTDWLVEKGYLHIETDKKGLPRKSPTKKGIDLGIDTELKKGTGGKNYKVNLYSLQAQEFLFQNIEDIIRFAGRQREKD